MTTRTRRTPNKVTLTPSGRFQVKFRDPDGRSTSRTFDAEPDAEAFARDGAAFGWARALVLADERHWQRDDVRRARREASPVLGVYARRVATGKVNASTRANYLARVAWIEAGDIGALTLAQVRPEDVEDFLSWLARQDKKVGRGRLAGRTVAQVYDFLVQVFRVALDKGLIEASPLARVERPAEGDTKPTRAMSPEEVRAVFAQAPDDNTRAFFEFLLQTGARVGEAQQVRWDEVTPVDPEGFCDVHIPGTKTANADRWVTIPAAVLPVPVDRFEPYMFDRSARYSQVFRDMASRAANVGHARAAGFEPMEYHPDDAVRADPRLLGRPTPHTLRHTHATRLFHSGALSETAIIARLGHASADYSRAHYVDMGEVKARHDAGRVAAVLFDDLGHHDDTRAARR